MNAIEVEHVSHRFQQHFWQSARLILNDVSFQVSQGSVVGFLGPNGAGKTTTIRALLGLFQPEHGQCRLWQQPCHLPQARANLGYLPERIDLPPQLTPRQLLAWQAQLTGMRQRASRVQAEACLAMIDMTAHANVPFAHLSKGQLQRIGVAQALIGKPTMLILDEPMSGLDPLGRHAMRQLIEQLQQTGMTIFFSTHSLADAEMLCDSVIILHRGQIRAAGPLLQLLPLHSDQVEIHVAALPEQLQSALAPLAVAFRQVGHQTRIALASQQTALQALDLLRAATVPIVSMQPMRTDLEGLFVQLLQQDERQSGTDPQQASAGHASLGNG